jgi:8-oxo-dGTP pyrophosphatase MutT (NUDIX family)
MSWKILSTHEIFKSKYFRLRADTCQLPDGRTMPRYYVFDFLDWVQIVPVTGDGQMILLNQYRHGAQKDFLEIPGGSTDLGETALVAAQRELAEETGFSSSEWIQLPPQYPNPALQKNQLQVFVALNCQKTQEQHLDAFEDLSIEITPVRTVYEQLTSGRIQHSLMISSLTLAQPYLQTYL